MFVLPSVRFVSKLSWILMRKFNAIITDKSLGVRLQCKRALKNQ